jgi:hypothetical protein
MSMLPEIDLSTLSDDELVELSLLIEDEQTRRWHARQPKSLVDDLRAALKRTEARDQP